MISILVLFQFISIVAVASPVGRLVGGPEELNERLDSVNVADFAKGTIKTEAGVVATQPLIRLLWASSLFSKTDWIGMQALFGIHTKIDPGGTDDGTNMFVYTCKAGWVDMGHVVYSALGYKLVSAGLKGNPLVLKNVGSFLPPKEANLFKRVAGTEYRKGILSSPEFKAQLTEAFGYAPEAKKVDAYIAELITHAKTHDNEEKVYNDAWREFFSMRTGFEVEEQQNRGKDAQKVPKHFDGWTTSAYTFEDLPSDYIGVRLGMEMPAKSHWYSNSVNTFQAKVMKLMEEKGAVSLSNTTNQPNCENPVGKTLQADALYYEEDSKKGLVDRNKLARQSKDPNSVYGNSIAGKKTKSHRCVCDGNNNPINIGGVPKVKAADQTGKKEKFKRARGPGKN